MAKRTNNGQPARAAKEYVVLARKVGNSIVITLPADLTREMEIESGEQMALKWDGEEIVVGRYR